MRKIPTDVLIVELRAYAEKLGYVPTAADMRASREVHRYETYLRRFGSWFAAIEAAGLNTSSVYRKKDFRHDGSETELLIREIRELAERLGRPPRIEEMVSQNQVHCASYYKLRFGSWRKVLWVAGLDFTYGDHYTDQELLDALREVCKRLSCIPSEKEYRDYQRSQEKAYPRCCYYIKHFGSFDEALITAGLKEASVEEYDEELCHFTKDEIIKILHEVTERLNRPPLKLMDVKKIRPDDYREIMSDIKLYFKDIRSALEAAEIGNDAWSGMKNVFWD